MKLGITAKSNISMPFTHLREVLMFNNVVEAQSPIGAFTTILPFIPVAAQFTGIFSLELCRHTLHISHYP
jgi:hypothetical protein